MSRGVCIFDLDCTLGDFRVIDFFGLIYEPKVISGFINKKSDKDKLINEIETYSKETNSFLEDLRNKFEKTVHEKALDNGILRPNLKGILEPLVEQFKKHKIHPFIIYSNNGNLYALEYASRSIENMFNTRNLFKHLLDRNHELRDKYDGSVNGSRSKMVATIKHLVPNLENRHILFMDDIIHNDFFTNLDSTYIFVPPYESNLSNERLEELWDTFETVFNSFDESQQKMFFEMYHIKTYLNARSLEQIKEQYLNYSKPPKTVKPFNENMPMIREKISSYIMKLPKVGGRRKTRRVNRTKRRRIY